MAANIQCSRSVAGLDSPSAVTHKLSLLLSGSPTTAPSSWLATAMSVLDSPGNLPTPLAGSPRRTLCKAASTVPGGEGPSSTGSSKARPSRSCVEALSCDEGDRRQALRSAGLGFGRRHHGKFPEMSMARAVRDWRDSRHSGGRGAEVSPGLTKGLAGADFVLAVLVRSDRACLAAVRGRLGVASGCRHKVRPEACALKTRP